MNPAQLYRHFDISGKLLYIGSSLNWIARLKGHKQSRWFGRIAKVTVEMFPDHRAALDAEREAIKRELPEFNTQHHPIQKPRPPRKFIRRAGECYIGCRVDRDVYLKLKQMADKDHRSLSQMCELLLIQGTATEILE